MRYLSSLKDMAGDLNPHHFVFLMVGFVLLYLFAYVVSFLRLLFSRRGQGGSTPQRQKLGLRLRTVSWLIVVMVILATIVTSRLNNDLAGLVMLVGLAIHFGFCVICGLVKGLIPWSWRTRSVRILCPFVDVKVEPFSFLVIMLFHVLWLGVLLMFVMYG